jgi:hypothetical protein
MREPKWWPARVLGSMLNSTCTSVMRCLQLAARHRRAPAAGARRVVRPVDPAVFVVLRMQRDIEQAALPAGDDLGQAFDRFRIEFVILADDAQPSGALGHQHAAVGQEGHGPGVLQAAHEGDDAEVVFFGFDGLRLCGGGRRQGHHQGRHSGASRNPEGFKSLRGQGSWLPLLCFKCCPCLLRSKCALDPACGEREF